MSEARFFGMPVKIDLSLDPGTIEIRLGFTVVGRIENCLPPAPTPDTAKGPPAEASGPVSQPGRES
jgi:hypothetical protein